MSGQKGSNGLSMQIMPTHLDYADDIYEDDDDYDSEDEYYEGGKTKISPRKQKKKVPRHLRRPKPNCCKQMCKRVTNRLVFGYHDKELEQLVSEYKIRDQHIGIPELSSFEEYHSIRHVADGEKDHKNDERRHHKLINNTVRSQA